MKLELKYPFTKRIGNNSWLKDIYEPVTCSENLISYKDPLCELSRLKSNISIQIGFLILYLKAWTVQRKRITDSF